MTRHKSDVRNIKEGSNFEILPAGVYQVSIAEVEEAKTRNGDDMTNVTYTILSGEYEGQKIWDRFTWQHGNPIMGRLKHFLHVIGETYEPEIDTDTADWEGKQLRVKTQPREYEGKTYPEVKEHLFFDPDGEEYNGGPLPGELGAPVDDPELPAGL